MSDPAAYTVGWICAMTTEYVAARVFLDEQHDHPEHTSIHDFNDYTLGKIGDHNVVIACVPDGEYGSASATNVVTNLLHSFANVKVGLLVGIGGGAPSSQHDVRLGDVVVSTAEVGKSGVVQFDFGRKFQHGEPFMTGAMNQTPNVLRTAVSELRTQHTICGNNIAEKIENLLKSRPRLRKRYERPSRNKDRLFKSSVSHDEACEESCSITPDHLVSRVHRDSDSDDPVIHYGLIASTNLVMKDARIRDQLARDEQVLCIDMAAFGLMNHFPCLVIRGICDYVDSHRGKEWQGFAAMTAAAYAKDLIRIIHVKSETNLSLSEFVSGKWHVRMSINQNCTYLWASCTLDQLSRMPAGKPEARIAFALEKLPDDIIQAYEDVLSRTRDHAMTRKALSGYSSTGYSESYATLHSESDDTYNDLMVMYVRELVDAIEAEVPFNRYNSQILERLELVVPDLLKGLALSLGHCTKEPAYLTLMVFIYKKRRDITVALIEAFTPDDTFPASAVPWMDRTNLWWRHTDSQEQTNLDDDLDQPQSFVPDYASPSRDEEQGTNDNSSYDAETQALSGYRTLLLQSPPYQWFIQTLQRECRVDAMSPNHMDTVRMRVLEHLPTSRIVSRRRPSESYKVLFRIDWDPVTFLLDQGYEGNLRDVVDIVVTLTGGMDDAQALTCSEYMRQTWPSSGSQILHLIKDVVSCDRGQHHTCKFLYILNTYDEPDQHIKGHIPNNTVITAWTIGPEFMVEACGTAYSVAEIGEQFAWLGAALRSSPHESGVTLIIAYIDDIVRNDQADKAHEMAVPSQSTVSLKFKMERQSENSDQPEKNKASSCQCWHEMFQNPVVVQGFPFLRRSEYHTGLELPLNMMAGLIDAERISVFEEKLFIKGHTRMLVPTRSTEDFLLWHLLQKEDGRPISFLDNPGAHATNLSVSHVKEVRNIVGWCSRAKLCAGAADARYDIKDSRLTRASPHSMLHKADLFKDEPIADVNTILISGDMELFKTPLVAQQGNITFLKPRSKQKPYVFVDRIRDISRQHVVLWDVQDQRGWLVNGSTALLHVLRANLEFRRRDEFGSGCLFEPRTMVEASEPGLSYSASQVLKNVSNRTLTVHQEDGTTSDERGNAILRLEALIEEFREALVKLGALQRKYNEITAMQRSSGDSECLEGWDFRDLAIQRKDCYPRVSSPIPISQSWALLLRSLNAVTIFGRDLGDLIVPYKDCSPCGHWVQLPSKQYYLAALVFDLHKIMDNESGSEHTSPRTLTSDLEWHDSGEKYDSCSCTGISTEKHADLVQLIGPLRSSQVQDGNTLALYERGAVIFGPQKETWKRNEKLESTGDVITRDGEGHISGENQSISIEEHISIPPPSSLSSMRQPPQPFNREDFRTAIVCALSTEFDAMRALLDGRYYCDYGKARNDPNSYVQGYIGGHNVVLVHMKVMGKVEAASVASTIPVSYPNIKLGLLVGICGGVPGGGESERVLGDIVISTGVVQFDKGAEYPDRFRRKNTLKDNLARPNSSIQRFLETTRNPHEKRFLAVLTDFFMLQLCYQDGFIGLGYLGVERDTLHRPNYYHKHRDTTLCKDEHGKRCAVKEHGGLTIYRKIHFGDVASGDKVMKSGELRDKIAAEQSIIAFEMEGAGMWDYMPTIVIKSICDYADSHKDKDWQKYAAATAAACAKALLYKMESEDPPSRYRDHCVEQTLYKQQPAHKTESEQASPVYLPHRTREGEAVGTKQLFLNPSTLNVKRKHGEGSSNSVGKRIRSESF
ncbi:hypothetical protein BKA63DRAFT_425181 [Paraphoma chrysanthemicola]|nr:hypothetical protein BKA63DRAFT_425181 [Paraphoma chrysanthemicola]